MPILATGGIVDPIAITNGEAALGAIPPDRALDKPWKRRRESRIELAGINLGGDEANDADTAFGAIASWAIGVLGIEAAQNAGSLQKIVDQPVNGDHPRPDLRPTRPTLACAKQQIGQRHAEHFVRDAVNAAQRFEQRHAHGFEPIWSRRVVGGGELSLDPGHEIAVGNVANE